LTAKYNTLALANATVVQKNLPIVVDSACSSFILSVCYLPVEFNQNVKP